MNWIKQHWKTILLILFAFLFVIKCSTSGNYKRAYNSQIERTEFVKDSLTNLYSNSAYHIDSLNILIKDLRRDSLYKEDKLVSYETQISDLKKQNWALANKKIEVKIDTTNINK